MELDYTEIGRRIARRRNELGLKQAQVEEMAGLGDKYLSSIERAVSIPSTEVIMRLAIALDTTPDEFLTGTAKPETDGWKSVAQMLPRQDEKRLTLIRNFIIWLNEQDV